MGLQQAPLRDQNDIVKSRHIDWDDVKADDVPIIDTGDIITATDVEGALAELKTELNAFPDELKNLATAEIQQLENIGANAISDTEWGYLAALNQGLTTTSTPTFSNVISSNAPTQASHLVRKDYVDGLVQGLDWQESVLDFWDASGGLPGSPALGHRYICSVSGNGWTIHHIYEYNGATWDDITPNEGEACWVEDEDVLYVYNGSSWVKFGSTLTHNLTSGLQGGTTNEYYHLTSAQHTYLTGSTWSPLAGSTSLVTLGTVTTGTWSANTILPAKGGTGVGNGINNTITFTGNYTLGITLTDNTVVTFPSSGTLLYSGGALGTPASGTLTNCTFPTLNQDTTGKAGSLKSVATTGVMTITGPTTGQYREKTIRDLNDTILELGGSYTPTGTWSSLKLNENVALTTTSTKLNYLTGATGTTGTNTTNIVFSTSPTLVTPTLGAATATSINKVAITAPTNSATLTIGEGLALAVSTANKTLTGAGTSISIGGNISTAGAFTTSGAYGLTFTLGSTRNITVPASDGTMLIQTGTTQTDGYFNTNPSPTLDGTVRLNYDGHFYATKVYGAVYNDYADHWKVDPKSFIGAGFCYSLNEKGECTTTRKRNDKKFIGIYSNTYGISVGKDKDAIPLCVSGFTLAYVDKTYKSGTPLVPNEDSILTKAHKWEKPVAKYVIKEKEELWNDVVVDNRHWIKII